MWPENSCHALNTIWNWSNQIIFSTINFLTIKNEIKFCFHFQFNCKFIRQSFSIFDWILSNNKVICGRKNIVFFGSHNLNWKSSDDKNHPIFKFNFVCLFFYHLADLIFKINSNKCLSFVENKLIIEKFDNLFLKNYSANELSFFIWFDSFFIFCQIINSVSNLWTTTMILLEPCYFSFLQLRWKTNNTGISLFSSIIINSS